MVNQLLLSFSTQHHRLSFYLTIHFFSRLTFQSMRIDFMRLANKRIHSFLITSFEQDFSTISSIHDFQQYALSHWHISVNPSHSQEPFLELTHWFLKNFIQTQFTFSFLKQHCSMTLQTLFQTQKRSLLDSNSSPVLPIILDCCPWLQQLSYR